MEDKKALLVTKDARDTTFENCDIEGAEIQGQGTKLIKTTIYNFRKKYPGLWLGTIISLITIIVGGIIVSLITEYFIK